MFPGSPDHVVEHPVFFVHVDGQVVLLDLHVHLLGLLVLALRFQLARAPREERGSFRLGAVTGGNLQ
jgi:hypothetical protein